jgi:hypothetical protein
VAEDLDHEEGVPLRLLVNGVGQGEGGFVHEGVSGGPLHERQHARPVEAREGEPGEPWPPAQVGEGVGQGVIPADLGVPVGADDQEPGGLGRAGDVAQQEQRGLGRPLEIVQYEQQGLVGGHRRQPAGHGIEEPVTLRFRIRAEGRRKPEEEISQFGDQAYQLARMASQLFRQVTDAGVLHHVAQRFDKGLVRNPEVLVAGASQDGGAVGVVHGLSQLGGQTGLSHPGLAGQEGEAELPRRRLLPQLLQALEFGLAGHEDPAGGPE